jgi:hypothetical protein
MRDKSLPLGLFLGKEEVVGEVVVVVGGAAVVLPVNGQTTVLVRFSLGADCCTVKLTTNIQATLA